MTTEHLTNEKRIKWLTERLETLEDMLDETSVCFGNVALIAEYKKREQQLAELKRKNPGGTR